MSQLHSLNKNCKTCDKPLIGFSSKKQVCNSRCHNKYEWANNPMRKHYKRKELYGISFEDYNNLIIKQKSLCAICKQRVKLFIDHDHITTRIRGLVCSSCNFGLGQFKDSIDLLKAAIEYLGTS